MQYTLIDKYENLTCIERMNPPTTIGWAYIIQGVRYEGKTRETAEAVMLRDIRAKTQYRSLTQVAKYIGYHLVSLDREGNMYLRSGMKTQGKFLAKTDTKPPTVCGLKKTKRR